MQSDASDQVLEFCFHASPGQLGVGTTDLGRQNTIDRLLDDFNA